MDIEKKILKKESLEKLFNLLKDEGNQIIAPVKRKDIVEFKPVSAFTETTWDYIQTVQSVKEAVFPKIETLFRFETTKTSTTVTDVDVDQYPPTVLWGLHPCDAASFEELAAVFTGPYTDAQFEGRYKKITVIGLSCAQADSYCFCTSVSIQPNGTKGSDILLTRLASGDYLAEIVTEKGRQLLNKSPDLFQAASGNAEPVVADVPVRMDAAAVTAFLKKNFEHPFWKENSLRCIGCGTCAYVCPVCTCYDIQDESRGKSGRRIRCWDSCGIGLFTLHSSGHNPRQLQSQRWRQRIMHKFSYIPDQRQALGCVGCGRCSRACPVDMNIAEQLADLAVMEKAI